ncbi:MAG: hypothetical protein ACOYJY_02465 [Acutalibacteraceae bacterium]|jgi:hypothetical protein
MAPTPFRIALAGITVEVRPIYNMVKNMCRDYLTGAPADFSVAAGETDIAFEREQSDRQACREGREPVAYGADYLETLAVYRQIADQMVDRGVLLFHGSAVAVDGIGYLFTAKSGTGKSTHTRLWRERFGERAVMINDDKPLLKITPEKTWVCGTPWDGKHRLSRNLTVPLKALVILERDRTNHIAPVDGAAALPFLLQQCYRPENPAGMAQVLGLLDQLTRTVALYKLGCNMDPQAAAVAYDGMQRE